MAQFKGIVTITYLTEEGEEADVTLTKNKPSAKKAHNWTRAQIKAADRYGDNLVNVDVKVVPA